MRRFLGGPPSQRRCVGVAAIAFGFAGVGVSATVPAASSAPAGLNKSPAGIRVSATGAVFRSLKCEIEGGLVLSAKGQSGFSKLRVIIRRFAALRTRTYEVRYGRELDSEAYLLVTRRGGREFNNQNVPPDPQNIRRLTVAGAVNVSAKGKLLSVRAILYDCSCRKPTTTFVTGSATCNYD